MNTINGKIRHKISKQPLENLIVVAYDFDISSKDQIQFAIDNGNYRLLASYFFGNDEKEDSNLPRISAGDRLGSTITNSKGLFEFNFEDSEFRMMDMESRPDIILFVLAPDSGIDDNNFVGTPEHFRILHLTFYPIRNAGKNEALIIDISNEQLLKFGLSPNSANEEKVQKIEKTIEDAYRADNDVNSGIKQLVRDNIAKSKIKNDKAYGFVSKLSALPKSFRENEQLFINKNQLNSESLIERQQIATKKGIDRIARQTLSGFPKNPKQFINIENDWLDRITSDENKERILDAIENGESLEAVEIDYGAYCAMRYSKNNGTVLRRNSNLLSLRKNRDEVVEKLRAIESNEIIEEEEDLSDRGRREGTPWVEGDSKEEYVKRLVLKQVQELSSEADVNVIGEENPAELKKQIKNIKVSLEELTPPTGPADVTAYYDFNTLQIAYPDVWTEAFDGNIENLMRDMHIAYEDAYEVYKEESGDVLNRLEDFSDEDLYDFDTYTRIMGQLSDDIKAFGPPNVPAIIFRVFAGGDDIMFPGEYAKLSVAQQSELLQLAADYEEIESQEVKSVTTKDDFGAGDYLRNKLSSNPDFDKVPDFIDLFKSLTKKETDDVIDLALEKSNKLASILSQGRAILSDPKGAGTKAQRIMAELAERLKHPHSFRIYAENSYNFGIVTTLRQKWIKGPYQATNLVSSITLAPGEKRTYVKKENIKKNVSRKEVEKNSSTLNDERTYSSKATTDVVEKVTKNTNFAIQHSSEGSGGMAGIFNIKAQTGMEFKRDQSAESNKNKEAVREATRKAAQEYKNERTLELSTDVSSDVEASFTSEISNPNNEITVTYLFYELERQYRVTEHLEKVTPVILVAQHVPAPHEIDEDWILSYEWIIRRSLLDSAFMDALDFVSEGLIGDEVALEVLRENHETQKSLVEELTTTVSALTQMQESLRDTLIQTSEREKIAEVEQKRRKKKRRRGFFKKLFNPAKAIADKIASGRSNLSFGNEDPALLEARREALETRLEYLDSNLADQQSQLAASNSALTKVSEDLEAAIKESFTKKNLVTQLKIHIKDNILYYMQAIWSHEYEHQRYMRLYNLPIEVPMPGPEPAEGDTATGSISVTPIPDSLRNGLYGSLGRFPNLVNFIGTTINWPTNDDGEAEYHTVSKKLHEIADVDNLMGFKGNYMMFPLKDCTFITDYMMQDYVDEYLGVRSPDPLSDYSTNELLKLAEEVWHQEDTTDEQQEALRQLILERLNSPVLEDDLIVLPTGQLYIEALKGAHALLEDFKLKHRKMDMMKVKEEVRANQLENLRKALRLTNEEGAVLDDPEVDKKVTVNGNTGVDIME